ncbi:MAG: imidazoleglycerol-phosphate dehydratase HisB [Proteocatella sp.]
MNMNSRISKIQRKTKETQISLELNLDGSGTSDISTGIGFLDHMLDLFTFHGSLDLKLRCTGDLDVDTHHSVEDIGIALGQAFKEALGDKKGIERYGTSYLPMDETLGRVVVDFSGRSYMVYRAEFKRENLGRLPTEEIREFFVAFANNAGLTLHAEILYGENDHHKAESLFKGLGRAIRTAVEITSEKIVSTKGVI